MTRTLSADATEALLTDLGFGPHEASWFNTTAYDTGSATRRGVTVEYDGLLNGAHTFTTTAPDA